MILTPLRSPAASNASIVFFMESKARVRKPESSHHLRLELPHLLDEYLYGDVDAQVEDLVAAHVYHERDDVLADVVDVAGHRPMSTLPAVTPDVSCFRSGLTMSEILFRISPPSSGRG